jgi:general secretion pathway protein K
MKKTSQKPPQQGHKRPSRIPNERGAALLIVMVMVALMAAFSVEFSYNTRVNLRMAGNLEKEVQAYYHARSAVEITRMVIRGQAMVDQMLGMAAQFMPNIKKQNIEMYNFAPKFVEIYNTGKVDLFGQDLFDLSGQTGIGVKKGAMEVTVDGEDGRANVNQVESVQSKRALFQHLFGFLQGPKPEGVGLTEEDKERAELILNIIDWVDSDEVKTDIDQNGNFSATGGPEDGAYARYDYNSKNAKMDSIDELRFIDGMDDETFCKIRDKVTVYATEKLNVNTADIGLLKAVICESMAPENQAIACGGAGVATLIPPIELVGEYIEICRNIKKMLFTSPFSSANSFAKFFSKLPPELAPLFPVNANALKQVVGVKSKIVRIEATGTVGNTRKEITAVIDTGSGKYVYWHEN